MSDTLKTITPKTIVHDLITAYPFLVQEFTDAYPKFSHLKNPAVRAVMARVATLERAAGMAGVPVSKLMQDIAGIIKRRTGEEVTLDVTEIRKLQGENRLLDGDTEKGA